MLEPYIIEDLKRREAERHLNEQQPRIELPLPPVSSEEPPEPTPEGDDGPEGGVVIIEL